jgi:hypothetical protein
VEAPKWGVVRKEKRGRSPLTKERRDLEETGTRRSSDDVSAGFY